MPLNALCFLKPPKGGFLVTRVADLRGCGIHREGMEILMKYNTAIVTLGYVVSPDRSRAMMMYHNANSRDLSYGKYNGYSDFLRNNESAYEAFCRVVNERTNLTVRKAQFRGSIHWPHFKEQNKSFFAQIFVTSDYEGIPCQYNELGQNRWVTVGEILRNEIPVWEGDKHFLPLVFDKNPTPFHGYMPYERGLPRAWFYQRG